MHHRQCLTVVLARRFDGADLALHGDETDGFLCEDGVAWDTGGGDVYEVESVEVVVVEETDDL